jgi:3-polyprenyl-4-hydroxybenzoate decarboxylase
MRAYQDLREFLSALEREQQLIRITEQVKFEPESCGRRLRAGADG